MRTEKIFDQKKFEDLLVLKWTEFIDGSKLIELISRLVEDNRDSFEHVVNTKYKKKNYFFNPSLLLCIVFQNTMPN